MHPGVALMAATVSGGKFCPRLTTGSASEVNVSVSEDTSAAVAAVLAGSNAAVDAASARSFVSDALNPSTAVVILPVGGGPTLRSAVAAVPKMSANLVKVGGRLAITSAGVDTSGWGPVLLNAVSNGVNTPQNDATHVATAGDAAPPVAPPVAVAALVAAALVVAGALDGAAAVDVGAAAELQPARSTPRVRVRGTATAVSRRTGKPSGQGGGCAALRPLQTWRTATQLANECAR